MSPLRLLAGNRIVPAEAGRERDVARTLRDPALLLSRSGDAMPNKHCSWRAMGMAAAGRRSYLAVGAAVRGGDCWYSPAVERYPSAGSSTLPPPSPMSMSPRQHRLLNFASIAGAVAATLAIVLVIQGGPTLSRLALLGGTLGNLLILNWIRGRR